MILLLTSCTKLYKEGGATQIHYVAAGKGDAAIANYCTVRGMINCNMLHSYALAASAVCNIAQSPTHAGHGYTWCTLIQYYLGKITTETYTRLQNWLPVSTLRALSYSRGVSLAERELYFIRFRLT